MSTSLGLSAKVRELVRRRPHLCTSLLRSPSWRASAMTSQMTISATLRVLLKGALNTGTPMELAACTGTVASVGNLALVILRIGTSLETFPCEGSMQLARYWPGRA